MNFLIFGSCHLDNCTSLDTFGAAVEQSTAALRSADSIPAWNKY